MTRIIDERYARSLAEKITQSPVTRASTGRNNYVFLSKDNVVSIPKKAEQVSYAIRAAATDALAENGIPVAEVVDHGRSDNVEYLVTRRIDAANMLPEECCHEDRLTMHQQTGALLRRIHAIPGKRYGRLDANLSGSHAGWHEFLCDYMTLSMERLLGNHTLWADYSRPIRNHFEEGLPRFGRLANPSFLHGDYHLGNLLFKGTDIKAVIDLDIVMSGDPYWDISHYTRTCKGTEEEISCFRDAYGANADLERERFYALLIWTRKVATQGIRRPEALRETIPTLRRILEQ